MPAFVFVHAKHPHMEAITQEYMDRNELMGGGSSANDRSLLTFSFKLYGLEHYTKESRALHVHFY